MRRVVSLAVRGLLLLGLLVPCSVTSNACSATSGANPAEAGDLAGLALEDRAAFAAEITKGAASDLERAHRVVTWFATNFTWTATDYEKRTVEEILARKGGNCAELARVATAVLEQLDLPMRQVREINIHVEKEARGEQARKKVAAEGYAMSVFGRRHNDHVWIEIQDRETGEWFPADPSLGVVGEEQWLSARLGFGERFTLDPTSREMVAPFAVFAKDADGRLSINRTAHYVIDGFDGLYGGRLRRLPAWKDWTRLVDDLDDAALAAFSGEANLHDREAEIDALASAYAKLKEQLAAASPDRSVEIPVPRS